MKSTHFRKFLKFSGIGVQLGVLMYLASYFGKKIDLKFQLNKPWFTLVFLLVSLVVFVWNLVRELNNLNKEE